MLVSHRRRSPAVMRSPLLQSQPMFPSEIDLLTQQHGGTIPGGYQRPRCWLSPRCRAAVRAWATVWRGAPPESLRRRGRRLRQKQVAGGCHEWLRRTEDRAILLGHRLHTDEHQSAAVSGSVRHLQRRKLCAAAPALEKLLQLLASRGFLDRAATTLQS